MNTRDRHVFAISILNGEKDAHKILADLLEEDGERALADWARAKKQSRYKRVDFVLGILAPRIGLQLVCEFLEQALERIGSEPRVVRDPRIVGDYLSFSPRDDPSSLVSLAAQVRTVGLWAVDEASQQAFHAACTAVVSVSPWRYGIQDIDQTMQSLHAAARCTEVAVALEGEAKEDSRAYRIHSNEARHAIRRVAKAARRIANPGSQLEQINYQIDRIAEFLGKIVNGATRD